MWQLTAGTIKSWWVWKLLLTFAFICRLPTLERNIQNVSGSNGILHSDILIRLLFFFFFFYFIFKLNITVLDLPDSVTGWRSALFITTILIKTFQIIGLLQITVYIIKYRTKNMHKVFKTSDTHKHTQTLTYFFNQYK